jgi:hypothetical protein
VPDVAEVREDVLYEGGSGDADEGDSSSN